MTRRLLHILLALALLPALAGSARYQCYYSAQVTGDYTTASGYVLHDVPIGRVEVSECTSPEDLAQRVAALTAEVRANAGR